MKEYAYISVNFDDETETWGMSDIYTQEMDEEAYDRIFDGDYVKRLTTQVKHITLMFSNKQIAAVFQRGMIAGRDFVAQPVLINDDVTNYLISESLNEA